MNDAYWSELCQVNSEVNAIPFNPLAGARDEDNNVWKDAPDTGTWVCRDYVLAKAKRLRELGWNPGNLTVIECYVETGEYHAVLAVEDDAATYILDNRQPEPYEMNDPPVPYRWHRRQVAGTLDFLPMA